MGNLPLERCPVNEELAHGGRSQGCLNLRLPGRGQLVLATVGLELQGHALPAPFSRAFELELDAALGCRQNHTYPLSAQLKSLPQLPHNSGSLSTALDTQKHPFFGSSQKFGLWNTLAWPFKRFLASLSCPLPLPPSVPSSEPPLISALAKGQPAGSRQLD